MRKKVSCHVITYNQKNYISQCIDGILMQQTDFPFEIIIGDDNSTDGTREILIQYQKKHPDKITLNLRKERGKGIPGKDNFISTLELCKGEYITLCDGDDYWNDPLKLQKQVDFLENNPDYVIACHDTKVINENNEIIRESKLEDKWKRDFSKDDLIKGVFIMPLTICFRNVIQQLPKEFYHVKNGDTFVISILGNYGKAKFQKEIIPAAYREHMGGVWSSESEINKLLDQQTTYYYMFLYYYKMKTKNVGVDYYFSQYQHACFTILSRFVKDKDFKNGFAAYLKFVFNCIKFRYFKSIYHFTIKSIKLIANKLF